VTNATASATDSTTVWKLREPVLAFEASSRV
jgi:hypothetical protein